MVSTPLPDEEFAALGQRLATGLSDLGHERPSALLSLPTELFDASLSCKHVQASVLHADTLRLSSEALSVPPSYLISSIPSVYSHVLLLVSR